MAVALPYPFHHLPRLTKAQVAVQQSVRAHFSDRVQQLGTREAVAALVEGALGLPCQIAAGELTAVSAETLVAQGPQPGCFIALAAAPGEARVVVDLDPTLASMAIERLLGGEARADAAQMRRPLSDIEAGVLGYLLLQVLAALKQGWESGRELALVLERMAASAAELGPFVAAQENYQACGVRIALGEHHGYARIYVPDALITERFGKVLPQGGGTPEGRAHMRRCLAAIGAHDVQLHLIASRLDLAAADIAQVEAGDIIVLENHGLTLTSDGIEGEVFVTVGRGRNGGFTGKLRNDESQAEQASLEIVRFDVQEMPAEEEMAASEQDDNLAETEGLLRDVDAPVAVELGRLRLSTAQVVRLRAGQVLRLTRGPTDPVDLVVNGKVFARGELIEVEGELGVRLTQVAGSD